MLGGMQAFNDTDKQCLLSADYMHMHPQETCAAVRLIFCLPRVSFNFRSRHWPTHGSWFGDDFLTPISLDTSPMYLSTFMASHPTRERSANTVTGTMALIQVGVEPRTFGILHMYMRRNPFLQEARKKVLSVVPVVWEVWDPTKLDCTAI